MTVSAAKDPKQAIGHSPDALTLEERLALTGKIIALEIYNPDTLPFLHTFGESTIAGLRIGS